MYVWVIEREREKEGERGRERERRRERERQKEKEGERRREKEGGRVKERLLLSFVNNKTYPNSAPFNQQRRIAKRLTKKAANLSLSLDSLSACIPFSISCLSNTVFVHLSLK